MHDRSAAAAAGAGCATKAAAAVQSSHVRVRNSLATLGLCSHTQIAAKKWEAPAWKSGSRVVTAPGGSSSKKKRRSSSDMSWARPALSPARTASTRARSTSCTPTPCVSKRARGRAGGDGCGRRRRQWLQSADRGLMASAGRLITISDSAGVRQGCSGRGRVGWRRQAPLRAPLDGSEPCR